MSLESEEGFPSAEEDEFDSALESIAGQLAELSGAERLPKGTGRKPACFDVEEVDMASGDWLLRVLQVQAWLGLGDKLSVKKAEQDAERIALQLFELIGQEDPASCVRTSDSVVLLTETGANHLTSRLDVADSRRREFEENFEELGHTSATKLWREAWEEDTGEESPDEQITATVTNWIIGSFARHAGKGSLDLSPSYQRGDVWPNTTAQELIVSILQGIPLPSVILLEKNHGLRFEIVDGKQRLTSILRFMGKHPRTAASIDALCKEYDPDGSAGLSELARTNFRKFKNILSQKHQRKLTVKDLGAQYLPFPLPSKKRLPEALKKLGGKYYDEIKDKPINISGSPSIAIQVVFEEENSPYFLSVISYKNTPLRVIHHVFKLYNKQGKKLTAEEIRNAVHHELDLTRLMLLASGDNRDQEALELDFLGDNAGPHLATIWEALDGYGYRNKKGYKRTKILCWLISFLFQEARASKANPGSIAVTSTAAHIEALFDAVADESHDHPLRSPANLSRLVKGLGRAFELHSGMDWEDSFVNPEGKNAWQELQLISSLLGVFLASLVLSDEEIESRGEQILAFSGSEEAERPKSPQNSDQWEYIGRLSLALLETLGASQSKVEEELLQRYSYTCLPTLRAMAALKKKTGAMAGPE